MWDRNLVFFSNSNKKDKNWILFLFDIFCRFTDLLTTKHYERFRVNFNLILKPISVCNFTSNLIATQTLRAVSANPSIMMVEAAMAKLHFPFPCHGANKAIWKISLPYWHIETSYTTTKTLHLTVHIHTDLHFFCPFSDVTNLYLSLVLARQFRLECKESHLGMQWICMQIVSRFFTDQLSLFPATFGLLK